MLVKQCRIKPIPKPKPNPYCKNIGCRCRSMKDCSSNYVRKLLIFIYSQKLISLIIIYYIFSLMVTFQAQAGNNLFPQRPLVNYYHKLLFLFSIGMVDQEKKVKIKQWLAHKTVKTTGCPSIMMWPSLPGL